MSEAYFELYKDKAGEYRWRLKAPNHEIIADSGEGYTEKRGAENGIDLVRKYAPEAEVKEKE